MRLGSLFSGYGGLDLGVQTVIGGEVAWHVDNDPGSTAILAHHWPDVPNLGDITAVDWHHVAETMPVDVLTGGFPCQDVSTAGRRAGMAPDTRSGLWTHMARAIAVLRPKMVVIENVRGLLSATAHRDVEPGAEDLGDGDAQPVLRALGAVLGDLAVLGYDAQWCGLRAADVGAPHGRFRVFVVATPAGRTDGGVSLDGGLIRGGGVHHRPQGHEGSTNPARHVHDRRGRDSEVCRTGRGGDSSWPVQATRLGNQADVPVDHHHCEWFGDGSEPDLAWTVLSTPCEGHRGDDDGPWRADGSSIVATDTRRSEIRQQPVAEPWRGGAPVAGLDQPPVADTASDGRHEGRPEPEGQQRGSDAALSGAASADPDGLGRQRCGSARGRREGSAHHGLPAADPDRTGRQGPEPTAGPDLPARGPAPYANGCGFSGDTECHGGKEGAHERARRTDPDGRVLDWGPYAAAIRQWEHILGRPAPEPTEPGRRGNGVLSPRFVEWLMGLPAAHVTDVPGLSRNAQLKALGNGVVPQQAAVAVSYLLGSAAWSSPAHAA